MTSHERHDGLDRAGLAMLGIDDAEELVYSALIDAQAASASDVARACGTTVARARGILATLEAKGLASRAPGKRATYAPVPPDLGLHALLLRKEEEMHQARRAAEELLQRFRASLQRRPPTQVLEVLKDPQAVLERFTRLQHAATEEFLILDKPPYAMNPTRPNEVEADLLERGVRYRVIYERDSIEMPGRLALIRELIAAGEDARTLVGVPMKLAVADRRMAIVPLARDEPAVAGAVVLLSSALLDALLALFDLLWERAEPLGAPPAPDHERDTLDAEVLGLLSLGMKDEAIARNLDVAVRTVARRVASLMDDLDARTRFQAGVRAAKRGLV